MTIQIIKKKIKKESPDKKINDKKHDIENSHDETDEIDDKSVNKTHKNDDNNKTNKENDEKKSSNPLSEL